MVSWYRNSRSNRISTSSSSWSTKSETRREWNSCWLQFCLVSSRASMLGATLGRWVHHKLTQERLNLWNTNDPAKNLCQLNFSLLNSVIGTCYLVIISEPVNIDLFLDIASLHPLFSTFRVEKSDDQKYVCVCRVGISTKNKVFKIMENHRSWQSQWKVK